MTTDVLSDELNEIAELEKQTPAKAEPEVKAEPEPKEPERLAEPEEHEDTVEVDNKGRFVRYGALHAERQERKKAEARAKDFESRYAQEAAQRASDLAKLNERLAIIAQGRVQQDAPRAPELPDVNTDPIAHFQARDEQRQKELNELRDRQKTQDQASEQSTQMQRIGAEVRRLEAEYESTTPDYRQAQQHLVKAWEAEAAIAGRPAEDVIRARTW